MIKQINQQTVHFIFQNISGTLTSILSIISIASKYILTLEIKICWYFYNHILQGNE